MASLFVEKTQVIHPLSVEASPHVHFVPLLRAETLFGNLALLSRRPRLYLRTFMRIVAGSYRRPAGGSLRGVLVFVKAAALARLVERLGVRHVHAHFIHHPATAAWAIHRLTGVSFSVTAHADDLFVGPALLRDKVSAAAFVATISEYNRSLLERLVPGAGRIEVVHCGVDPRLLPYRERKGVNGGWSASRGSSPRKDTATSCGRSHSPRRTSPDCHLISSERGLKATRSSD